MRFLRQQVIVANLFVELQIGVDGGTLELWPEDSFQSLVDALLAEHQVSSEADDVCNGLFSEDFADDLRKNQPQVLVDLHAFRFVITALVVDDGRKQPG